MTKSLVFICLCFIVTTFAQVPPWDETCVTGKYPPTDPSLFVPTYVVNLDLPAEQRWVDISKKYSQQVGIIIIRLFVSIRLINKTNI
jgi:hypothetical protein